MTTSRSSEPTLLNHPVSVGMTPRMHAALRGYTDSLGVSMSEYVRALVRETIPPRFWSREEPPPGQLTIEVGDE